MSDSAELDRLLVAARNGDGVALGQLLDSYRSQLRETIDANIHGPLQRRIDASDVIQQTCVQAVRNFSQFRGSTLPEFWGWLEQVEQHMLVDLVREHGAQKRDAHTEQSGPTQNDAIARATTAGQHAMRGERRRELEAAISQLPAGQREAVALRYLDEHKIADIATALDRSEEAVAGLLKRGVRALKAILNDRSL